MSLATRRWVLRGTSAGPRPIVVDGPALDPDAEIVVCPSAEEPSRQQASPAPRHPTAGFREALLFIYGSGTGALGIWRALIDEIARRENKTPAEITDEINHLIATGAAGPAPTFEEDPSLRVQRSAGRTVRRSPPRTIPPPTGLD